MVLVTDVAYAEDGSAYAAGVGIRGFDAPDPIWEGGVVIAEIAPYEPGAFYKRELPCLLAVLATARAAGVEPQILVVDGYASFGIAGREALGERLARASGLPVIGVAKTAFAGAKHHEVLRGSSAQPLFVTAVDVDIDRAAEAVRSMHGDHRLPTILARVDRAARQGLAASRSNDL